MSYVLAIARLLIFIMLLTSYLTAFGLVTLFYGYSLARVLRWKRSFCRLILKLLNVVIIKEGTSYNDNAYLVINNHRSYLDPIIAMTEYLSVAVAKAEVRRWPLIGVGALISGVIFVQRDLQSSRQDARRGIGDKLRAGYSVYICPEGTTTIQPTTLPFRKSVFHLAADEHYAIIPVTIEYADLQNAFVGQDTFLPHFLRTFARIKNPVMMVMGQPLKGNNAELLLQLCQRHIDQNLVYCRERLKTLFPQQYDHSRIIN